MAGLPKAPLPLFPARTIYGSWKAAGNFAGPDKDHDHERAAQYQTVCNPWKRCHGVRQRGSRCGGCRGQPAASGARSQVFGHCPGRFSLDRQGLSCRMGLPFWGEDQRTTCRHEKARTPVPPWRPGFSLFKVFRSVLVGRQLPQHGALAPQSHDQRYDDRGSGSSVKHHRYGRRDQD